MQLINIKNITISSEILSLSLKISILFIAKDMIRLIKKNIAAIAGAEKSKKTPKQKLINPYSFCSKLSNCFKSIATQKYSNSRIILQDFLIIN